MVPFLGLWMAVGQLEPQCSDVVNGTVAWPAGLRIVSAGRFEGCTALSWLVLPRGVTSVGARAFKDSGLRTVSLLNPGATFGAAAFGGTPVETVLTDGVRCVDDGEHVPCACDQRSLQGPRHALSRSCESAVHTCEVSSGHARWVAWHATHAAAQAVFEMDGISCDEVCHADSARLTCTGAWEAGDCSRRAARKCGDVMTGHGTCRCKWGLRMRAK